MGSFAVIPELASPLSRKGPSTEAHILLDIHRDASDWASRDFLPSVTPNARGGRVPSCQSQKACLGASLSVTLYSDVFLLSTDTRVLRSLTIPCHATSASKYSARPSPSQGHQFLINRIFFYSSHLRVASLRSIWPRLQDSLLCTHNRVLDCTKE